MKFIARIDVNKKRCIIVVSTTEDASFYLFVDVSDDLSPIKINTSPSNANAIVAILLPLL